MKWMTADGQSCISLHIYVLVKFPYYKVDAIQKRQTSRVLYLSFLHLYSIMDYCSCSTTKRTLHKIVVCANKPVLYFVFQQHPHAVTARRSAALLPNRHNAATAANPNFECSLNRLDSVVISLLLLPRFGGDDGS